MAGSFSPRKSLSTTVLLFAHPPIRRLTRPLDDFIANRAIFSTIRQTDLIDSFVFRWLVNFIGRHVRSWVLSRKSRSKGMPGVPVRAEIERFIDFFNEFLECLTLLQQPSHLRSIEPSPPWIWSTDQIHRPKRAPFSESLISVLLAFFLSNQPASRRIWCEPAPGPDWLTPSHNLRRHKTVDQSMKN